MNWWNVWTRSWYLIGEHAYVDMRASRTVACRICAQHYDSYESMHRDCGRPAIQGHDICADIRFRDGRWIIVCGYGSSFDLMEFWYLRDFPTKPIDGVCDWCIRRMVRDGVIMDSGKELHP